MVPYASLSDLYAYGMPLVVMGSVSAATQQKLLDGRNDFADDKMRARYRLPLLTPYPVSLIQNICMLAAWDVMMVRGYNPGAGADINIEARGNMALKWFDDVERQRCHPDVRESTGPDMPGYAAPAVISSPRQGWSSTNQDGSSMYRRR
jgi:phage gp36-like protein